MRRTPQTVAVLGALSELGHATNLELKRAIKAAFPEVTASTVHRITERMVDSKLAAYGPSLGGVKVIDRNTDKHDHFFCSACEKLIDINLKDETVDDIQSQLPSRLMRSSIVISGVCEACTEAAAE